MYWKDESNAIAELHELWKNHQRVAMIYRSRLGDDVVNFRVRFPANERGLDEVTFIYLSRAQAFAEFFVEVNLDYTVYRLQEFIDDKWVDVATCTAENDVYGLVDTMDDMFRKGGGFYRVVKDKSECLEYRVDDSFKD